MSYITEQIKSVLDLLGIDPNDCIVSFSCVLYVLGLIEGIPNDYDIVVNEKAWKVMLQKNFVVEKAEYGGKVIRVGNFEFYNKFPNFFSGESSLPNLKIEGINYMNPKSLRIMYIMFGRIKDDKKIDLLTSYINSHRD